MSNEQSDNNTYWKKYYNTNKIKLLKNKQHKNKQKIINNAITINPLINKYIKDFKSYDQRAKRGKLNNIILNVFNKDINYNACKCNDLIRIFNGLVSRGPIDDSNYESSENVLKVQDTPQNAPQHPSRIKCQLCVNKAPTVCADCYNKYLQPLQEKNEKLNNQLITLENKTHSVNSIESAKYCKFCVDYPSVICNNCYNEDLEELEELKENLKCKQCDKEPKSICSKCYISMVKEYNDIVEGKNNLYFDGIIYSLSNADRADILSWLARK